MLGLDILCLLFLVGFTLTGVRWQNWQQTVPTLGSVNVFPLSDSIVNGTTYSYLLTGLGTNGFGSQGTVVLSITSGALPSGLTLGPVIYGTFPDWSVVLSGVPNDADGNYSVSIFATNGGVLTDTAVLNFSLSGVQRIIRRLRQTKKTANQYWTNILYQKEVIHRTSP